MTRTVPAFVTHAAGWMCPLTPLAMRMGFGGQSSAASPRAVAPALNSTTPVSNKSERDSIGVAPSRKGAGHFDSRYFTFTKLEAGTQTVPFTWGTNARSYS